MGKLVVYEFPAQKEWGCDVLQTCSASHSSYLCKLKRTFYMTHPIRSYGIDKFGGMVYHNKTVITITSHDQPGTMKSIASNDHGIVALNVLR